MPTIASYEQRPHNMYLRKLTLLTWSQATQSPQGVEACREGCSEASMFTHFLKCAAYTAKWGILQENLMSDKVKADYACQVLVNISSSRLLTVH